ncbi:MAG TPA: DUF3800 domain-containing protein [Gemmatimonadaceae bacterium]|nr:DUF3800 domain-containing protein [Gemmatimonadaceae bacterium]
MIADPRHEAFSRALRNAVMRFHQVGTQWATLHNIVESVLFLPSHESPGVQLADLTSYALWRAAEANDPTLAMKLKYCFDREDFGSSITPGKWHGIRYRGPASSPARRTISTIWPA